MKKKLFSEIPFIRGERLTIKAVKEEDADSLQEMIDNPNVYKYEPSFLFEKRYDDVHYVIEHLYDECWKESILLGIYEGESFCGLIEMYGYRKLAHKVSVGYRLLERYWGKGIASEALGMLVNYLADESDIEFITASTMLDNKASANVLKKNKFIHALHAVPENWGFDKLTPANKWFRRTHMHRSSVDIYKALDWR